VREHLAEAHGRGATDVPFGKVTYSAGLADELGADNPQAVLKAADDALYAAANKEGRNRIVRAPVEARPAETKPIPLRPPRGEQHAA